MPLRTPLYDWHVAHGARVVEFGGWDMPVQYTGIVEEHTAVRTAAGLFDISHMGRLTFEGPDALDFLQSIYTNDADSMKPGQVRYGLVCNEQGGVLDDVLVYRLERFWLMVVNASNRLKILDWIERHRGARNVTVTDSTFEWAMVAIQGPRFRAVTDLAGDLKYYFAAIRIMDDPGSGEVLRLIASRTGYTGEDGCEVIMPARAARVLCDYWIEQARSHGLELKPCGLGARDTLRLEAAMPLYGHELSEEIDPLQAGLAWAVKFDKGDFIGRTALLKRRGDPALPRRVGLELTSRRIAREGAEVLVEGRVVGRVTSGTFAPTLNRAIAMAYVEPGHAAEGTACTVDVRGKEEAARVVPLPFYRRPKT
jgi:aminomethyltransferase